MQLSDEKYHMQTVNLLYNCWRFAMSYFSWNVSNVIQQHQQQKLLTNDGSSFLEITNSLVVNC